MQRVQLPQEILLLLSILDNESAAKIIQLGYELHQESKFRDTPFIELNCWNILSKTQQEPQKFFLAYDEDFRGFIIMQATVHYFSGEIWTADLAYYVKPEYRGTEVSPNLLKAAQEWSKSIGAKEMTIFHNTGIKTESSERFFNKNGFTTAGYIFTKELKEDVRNS